MSTIFPTKSLRLNNKAFIFGGAYGNLQATKAILKKAEELGFDRSEIIFTGDMVAYCAKPLQTLNLIRSSVDHIIMGNCEEAIANGEKNCGCGFEEGSKCSILSNQWYDFCVSKIDTSTAQWMAALPKAFNIQMGDYNLLATHATPDTINEFVFPSNLTPKNDSMEVDGYIVGHSGIPFIASLNHKPWINSGASGMPANDGTSRVWFATVRCTDEKLSCETQSLFYSVQDAENDMRLAQLENGYMECLSTGIWPSHDVLPEKEKYQTSIRLQPQKKAFMRTPFRINSSV